MSPVPRGPQPEPARPAGRGLLRDRDFGLLWAGETVSAIGTAITQVALPLAAVVELHAGAFRVSLLTAAVWVPWLLIGLPAGAWVDRLPRRPVMLTCDLAALLALASTPVAAAAGVLTYAQLLAVAVLVGACAVFFQTAYQVYLPGFVAEAQLAEANARLQGSQSAAQIAGPALAGLLTQAVGAVTGLAADAVSYGVSALGLALIRRRETAPPPVQRAGLRREIGQGLRFLLADPYLRVFTGYGALSNLALTGYQSILIVFLIRTVGVTPGTVGGLLSGMSAGGLLGAATATRLARRIGTARAAIAANLAAGPFALLIPLATRGPRLALVVIGGLGVGAAVVAGNVIRTSFRQAYTPRQLLGRVTVAMQFLNYGTIPAGAVLAGSLAAAAGPRTAEWAMTLTFALAPLLLFIGPAKRHRDLPAHPAPSHVPAGHPPAPHRYSATLTVSAPGLHAGEGADGR